MDFFYEGGRMVRPDREQNRGYLEGILDFLGKKESTDFMIIQEIDFRSKRSYGTDQFEAVQAKLDGHHGDYAINYKSAFVPSPFREPMGRVKAGQATFSRHIPASASRIATPGAYAWPVRLFMLKRCFLVSRYPVENGRELVLFNIHNSAFDDAGDLREKELELLRELALSEYTAGHYVVIGGDWNQNPPGWTPSPGRKYLAKELWPIEGDYMPEGWTWAFDPAWPTNREVSKPFNIRETLCTSLDFFLVSPNISVDGTEALDMEFRFSDHQPVIMGFTLR
jgi:endonuclease/exonuclease/phosphatase family metal-dependent hydrolase